MDALQWMGAVRMRVQTADKNITIIHTTASQQLMTWEVKSCVFVRNKSIIKTFLTSNHCFWPKYESIIHNTSSSEKVFWSESGEKSAQIKHRLQAKTVLNKYVCEFWCERQQEMDLFHWRKCYYGLWTHILARSNGLKSKTFWWICFLQTHSSSLLKTLIVGLQWCGLLVDYCDVFISCLGSYSDGTHLLQRIHWWASDAMLHFSKM